MKTPKLLVLDIETGPHDAYVWKLWDENVGLSQLKRASQILSVGRHWLGTPAKAIKYDDVWPYTNEKARRRMLERVHADLSNADGVITYNGSRFDMPKLNGAFLSHGLKPIAPLPHIDVYNTVKRLGLASGKLEYVAPALGCGRKMPSDFTLWRRYLEGDRKAREKMRRYNSRDVLVLERLFRKVQPLIRPFPRFHDHPACPYCGNSHVQSRGYRYTEYFKIERHQCQNHGCYRWFDGKRSKR